MNIGLIGLGAMGGAYAKHLITNNFNCYGIDLDKKNISRFLNLGGSEITYPNIFNKVDVLYSTFKHEVNIFWGRKTKYLVKNLPFSVMEIFLIEE